MCCCERIWKLAAIAWNNNKVSTPIKKMESINVQIFDWYLSHKFALFLFQSAINIGVIFSSINNCLGRFVISYVKKRQRKSLIIYQWFSLSYWYHSKQSICLLKHIYRKPLLKLIRMGRKLHSLVWCCLNWT